MVDEIRPIDGPGCDEVREAIELLALDALDRAEQAVLMAHVDGCPSCRAELDRAEATLGALLSIAPDEPAPAGFTDRVLGATVAAPTPRPAAAGPSGPLDVEAGSGSRGSGSRRWFTLAVAGVAVALLVTALGVALGSVFASDGRVAGPPVTAAPGSRSGVLVTAEGAPAGSVVVDDGTGTLVMVVDAVAPGVGYDCVVRSSSGALVQVGSWTPATAGTASWTVALDPALGPVDEVLLVGPGDTTLATAQLT